MTIATANADFDFSSGSFETRMSAATLVAALNDAGIWACIEGSSAEFRVFMPEYNEYWWPMEGFTTLSAGIPQFAPDWITFYFAE